MALYALNPDGSFKWRFDQDGYIYELAIGSADSIYIASGNGSGLTNSTEGRLIAVGSDGVQDWEYPVLEPNSLCIASSGNAVFSYADGGTALAPDGSVDWDYPTDIWTSSLLLDSADNSYFFTAVAQPEGNGNDITLHSVDAGGIERWSLLLTGVYLTYSLALRDDGALVMTYRYRLTGSGESTRMMVLQ